MRVTDDMIRGFLTWALKYGEIESYTKIEPGNGRCWKIVMPRICRAHGTDEPLLGSWEDDPIRIVPTEIVLTAREALVFGYGLAIGGASERRSDFAAREWGWERTREELTTKEGE